MKELWKHLLCAALCLCMLFSSALAEGVDINLHVVADYSDADATIIRSGQVVGESLYLLVGGLYGSEDEGQVKLERWTAGMSGPETVLEGLISYRNEDADDTMPVVQRLMTDGECLYGYDESSRQVTLLVDAAAARRPRRCARWRRRRKRAPRTTAITVAMSAPCSCRMAKW